MKSDKEKQRTFRNGPARPRPARPRSAGKGTKLCMEVADVEAKIGWARARADPPHVGTEARLLSLELGWLVPEKRSVGRHCRTWRDEEMKTEKKEKKRTSRDGRGHSHCFDGGSHWLSQNQRCFARFPASAYAEAAHSDPHEPTKGDYVAAHPTTKALMKKGFNDRARAAWFGSVHGGHDSCREGVSKLSVPVFLFFLPLPPLQVLGAEEAAWVHIHRHPIHIRSNIVSIRIVIAFKLHPARAYNVSMVMKSFWPGGGRDAAVRRRWERRIGEHLNETSFKRAQTVYVPECKNRRRRNFAAEPRRNKISSEMAWPPTVASTILETRYIDHSPVSWA
ncbi:hypothetical protein GALMADRAFT_216694 [Galerina marginata CBS 339.88]|uniref:Uncharacterized protein n=1 Tax=Galerina marginata (strain CBS 339.88) TaxID=685588 RepID=A0A067SH25_GALM3|nr:hypothetical protein GALMADRAFT_216694 [Galerina marginata CBS 339.88]